MHLFILTKCGINFFHCQSITFFSGGISGFENDDDERYIKSCSLYTIEPYKFYKIAVYFRDENIFVIFKNIISKYYDRNPFVQKEEERSGEIAYNFKYRGDEVVMILEPITFRILRIEGEGFDNWHKKAFCYLGKQLHIQVEVNYF